MTDHTGAARTLADYRGKVVAIFFGFTQCPDVCPTTLTDMAEVKKQLGKDGEKLQVLFITVDPERDTQMVLSKYVPAFDPSFVGLYGSPEQTAATAKEFKVFYQKVAGKTATSYPSTTPPAPMSSTAREGCGCSCATSRASNLWWLI